MYNIHYVLSYNTESRLSARPESSTLLFSCDTWAGENCCSTPFLPADESIYLSALLCSVTYLNSFSCFGIISSSFILRSRNHHDVPNKNGVRELWNVCVCFIRSYIGVVIAVSGPSLHHITATHKHIHIYLYSRSAFEMRPTNEGARARVFSVHKRSP